MVQNKTLNVLFTSVGRRVELVRAFRQALADLGLEGKLVGTDINPLAPALHTVDKPYLVPRFTTVDYVPTLIEICQREQIDMIFPLIDPDIPILAKHRDLLESSGAKVFALSSEMAEVVSDKWKTSTFFAQHKIPTPRSWLPESLDSGAAFPLFIKPRRGSASEHTFKLKNAQELNFFCAYVPDPIIQEYLPGPEITTDVMCDASGKVLSVVSRQRMEVRGGEVVKGVTISREDIHTNCIRIAEALNAVGPITVQCLLRDDQPYFTEINARFGGGLPLGIAAGVASHQWLLASFAELPLQVPPIGVYQEGLYLSRFDDSFFISEVAREQMASHRL